MSVSGITPRLRMQFKYSSICKTACIDIPLSDNPLSLIAIHICPGYVWCALVPTNWSWYRLLSLSYWSILTEVIVVCVTTSIAEWITCLRTWCGDCLGQNNAQQKSRWKCENTQNLLRIKVHEFKNVERVGAANMKLNGMVNTAWIYCILKSGNAVLLHLEQEKQPLTRTP